MIIIIIMIIFTIAWEVSSEWFHYKEMKRLRKEFEKMIKGE